MNRNNQIVDDNNITHISNATEIRRPHISVPCKQCICLPICRHKDPNALYNDCDILSIYEPNFFNYNMRSTSLMTELFNVLQPSTWTYEVNEYYQTVKPIIIRKTYKEVGFEPILNVDDSENHI